MNRIFIPQLAIRTILSLDISEGCSTIKEVWKKNNGSNCFDKQLREKTISYLSIFFKEDEVSDLLFYLKDNDMDLLSEDDISNMDEIIFKNQLSKEKNQSSAWNMLWENSKINNASHLLKNENMRKWYRAYHAGLQVIGKPDIQEVLKASIKTNDKRKKYFFLVTACYLINGRRGGYDKSITQHIKKLINNYRLAYPEVFEYKGKDRMDVLESASRKF